VQPPLSCCFGLFVVAKLYGKTYKLNNVHPARGKIKRKNNNSMANRWKEGLWTVFQAQAFSTCQMKNLYREARVSIAVWKHEEI
jgi:hypothetical protein